MGVVTEVQQVLTVRLIAAGQAIREVDVTRGTTVRELIDGYRDKSGRMLVPESNMLEFFVNGASVDEDYEFDDDNQMLIIVGAVYNG